MHEKKKKIVGWKGVRVIARAQCKVPFGRGPGPPGPA